MATHHATITVTRDGEDVEVEVAGDFEYSSSPNPNETGYGLEGLSVESPKGLVLTGEERISAEEALYDSL